MPAKLVFVTGCDQAAVGLKQPMSELFESCRKMPLALLVFAGFGWEFSRMKPSVNAVEKQLLEAMAVAEVMRHESEKPCNISIHFTLGQFS